MKRIKYWIESLLVRYRILANEDENMYYAYWDQEYKKRGR